MSFIVEPDSPKNRDGKNIGRQIRDEKTEEAAVEAYCQQMNCESAHIQGAASVIPEQSEETTETDVPDAE